MFPGEIEVPKIQRQRQRGHDHADGVFLVKREVAQRQHPAEHAAFSESDRNDSSYLALGSELLDDESHGENDAPAQSDDFARVKLNPEIGALGQELHRRVIAPL